MISVEEALAQLFELAPVLGTETVPLRAASGRVLAEPVVSLHDQPPFRASVMDGYALHGAAVRPGATFRVVGEAAAGSTFAGDVAEGEAVRIFTGAPVPDGLDRVVIQEDVEREGDSIRLEMRIDEGPYIRARAGDFSAGDTLAPRRLRPVDISLVAAMGHATVAVRRRPEVALVMTGDELVMPGEAMAPGQIVASNGFGLAAMLEAEGAVARLLPIARDEPQALRAVLGMTAGADLVVTIGGASVGAHDLVAQLGSEDRLERAFYKVAMRPGKPLMAGRLGGTPMVGLPGNPVSSMVCGVIFILPMIRAMLGLGRAPAPRLQARLAEGIGANGPREHYMRALIDGDTIRPFARQDSSLLSVLAGADALLVRPPNAGARPQGAPVDYVPL